MEKNSEVLQNEVARARAAKWLYNEIEPDYMKPGIIIPYEYSQENVIDLLAAYIAPLEQRWIPISDSPENHGLRNKSVVYWNKDAGYVVADEWRNEHHAEHATEWLYDPRRI